MDHQRASRMNRTYYRSNYSQPPPAMTVRPTLEERLHARGISTSSNSSWTFSNSHSDLPRKKKGRLCGLFLMAAVFVVLLAVIAIGGLAFYLGAVRLDTVKQDLTFDGSLRVTYGDQYQTILSNRSSKSYREKASRYSNMLTTVFRRSVVGPALDDVRVLRFENGSLIVHFRMNLDRRKLPNTVTTSLEDTLKSVLVEEISSVKPVAFRNLQVDHHNVYIKRYLGEYDVVQETHVNERYQAETTTTTTAKTEVKNGVVRKVAHHNKTNGIPEGAILGISEKMQNFSDTLKRRHEETSATSTTASMTRTETTSTTTTTTTAASAVKSVEYEVDKEVHSDAGPQTNGHARPAFQPGVQEPFFDNPNPGFIVPDYDEPWRPIIPPSPLQEHKTGEDSLEKLLETPDEVLESGGDGPITFSRDSYEENLRIFPEYGGDSKNLERLTEEIAKKYDELVKKKKEEESASEASLPLGLDQIISGISVVETEVDDEPAVVVTDENPATTMTPTTTTAGKEESTTKKEEAANTGAEPTTTATSTLPNATRVENPFQESQDSRSSQAFGFLPDFPILKQFHHLDSLLKSFSAEAEDGSGDVSDGTSSPTVTPTRFPVRTKPTTYFPAPTETVYVAIGTVSPDNVTKLKSEYRPVVIRGEVQVVDSKTLRSTTEQPKLITLLPVRSNVVGPLRPRPKSEARKSKMAGDFAPRILYSVPQKHHFVDDKDGKRWVYYSSSKWLTTSSAPPEPEKIFIVTPQSEKKKKSTTTTTTTVTPKPTAEETEAIEGREDPDEGRLHVGSNVASVNTSELINRIVNIMENVVISTGNATKLILKVNQTIINATSIDGGVKPNETAPNDPKFVISNKAVSSDNAHYKLNQAGVPILTKILNKAPDLRTEAKTENMNVDSNTSSTTAAPRTTTTAEPGEVETSVCENNAFPCGNGTCIPLSLRCNQQVDCPEAADEKNCTCAEHLRQQHLNRKLCDGIVDCWDFSDEFDCDWCKGKDYLCSNSKVCIKKTQICDGANNCPLGDDEKYCVTVSPNEREANSFNYHPNGYLMVRKHGEWGKLCIDNFDAVSARSKTGWKISDLGRSVCKALTFKDFEKVERTVSIPNEGRSTDPSGKGRFYELSYNDVSTVEESSTTRDSTLTFHETECDKREVVKVTCTELECGLRPQAMNQWSRIVGGGNANPGSWPWQAALYKEGEFQCGATLISGQWLVSAGHCFYHNQDEYWVARLGTLRTTSSLPSPYEQLRQISKIILHPHYVDTGFINDISLLKMAQPVTFTDYVRPICLPRPNARIIDGMMCTVVGWGQLFEMGRIFPDTLQEVQLPIISSTECRKRTVFLPLYKITDDMFCAGYDRGGRDACLGDSGGPLMCQEPDGKWSLYGVTSNGYGCARSNRPGVYTKVSKYLNWLQSQMHLHSEDEILSQSSLKHIPISSQSNRESLSNSSYDKSTDALVKLISERVSNVKVNGGGSGGAGKRKDNCKGHRCPLGECLSKSRLCNGLIECSDGSDEKDCW